MTTKRFFVGIFCVLTLTALMLLCAKACFELNAQDTSIEINETEYIPLICWLNEHGYVVSTQVSTTGFSPNGQAYVEYKHHIQKETTNFVLTVADCGGLVVSVMMDGAIDQPMLPANCEDYVVQQGNIYISSVAAGL